MLTGLAPFITNANASGFPFTAAYVNVTGDLPADILSNIAVQETGKPAKKRVF